MCSFHERFASLPVGVARVDSGVSVVVEVVVVAEVVVEAVSVTDVLLLLAVVLSRSDEPYDYHKLTT